MAEVDIIHTKIHTEMVTIHIMDILLVNSKQDLVEMKTTIPGQLMQLLEIPPMEAVKIIIHGLLMLLLAMPPYFMDMEEVKTIIHGLKEAIRNLIMVGEVQIQEVEDQGH